MVIHCAGIAHQKIGAVSLDTYMRVNSEATESFVEAVAKAGVNRFVFLSLVKVNGEFTEQGICKSANLLSNGLPGKDVMSPQRVFKETDLACPEDPYAISKLEAEQVRRLCSSLLIDSSKVRRICSLTVWMCKSVMSMMGNG